MLSVLEHEDVFVANIDVPERLRQMDIDRVEKIAESMEKIGLQTPITVRSINDGEIVLLVAGRHRLEAAARLGWDKISATFVVGEEDDFRLWEIAENLHRSELTVLERSEHIAEWIRLTDTKVAPQPEQAPRKEVAQVAPLSGHKAGRGQKSGVRAAARELGVDRDKASRAIKIDSIIPEAKQAAQANGVDKNQSALLKVAATAPEKQVAAVAEAARKPAKKIVQEHVKEAVPDAAFQAVAMLRDKLGPDYEAFLDLARPIGAKRLWDALFEDAPENKQAA